MATPEEIKIRIIAKDEASKVFQRTKGASDSLKSSVNKLKIALAGIGIAGGVFLKSVIDTGAQVQALRVRLNYLTGSVQSGSKAFQIMTQYASSVPFALEEIQQGSAQLLTVAGSVEELNGLLQITGDLAAVSGLSFVEAASQLQRSFSAGIASADLFRERGVSAFLGFQSGVSYSAQETRKQIISAFADGTTSAKGATKDLANTYIGQISMMQDAFFNFKVELADTGLIDEATKQIKALTEIMRDPQVISGVKTFTSGLLNLFQFVTRNAQVLMAVGATWLGVRVGGALGSALGKKGKVIGSAVGGLTTLLGYFKLMEESTDALRQDLTVYVPDAIESSDDAFKTLSKSVQNTDTEVKKLTKTVQEYGLKMQEVEVNAVTSLEDSLVGLINGTQSASQAFRNMANSIINDLIRMAIQKSITNKIMGFAQAGALTPALRVAGVLPMATPATEGSFAGGGYTGSGSRSGGVDGKGGFPAILHPNETVIDHSKGQSVGGQPVVVNLNISTGVSQTVRAEVMNMLPMITNATKSAVIDAKRRGGSFARGLG